MSVEVKVPVLPESVSDATVAQFNKQPGEAVSLDENLLDLETDKVMLEVPSPVEGVLEKWAIAEGDTVQSGELLAVIKEGAVPAAADSSSDQASNESENKKASGDAELSPAVRRLVQEKNLDASQIKGTGKGGRITKEDVLAHVSSAKASSKTTKAPSAPESATMLTGDRVERRVPMSRLRTRIAERLLDVQDKAAILTTFNEVNMAPVMNLRKQYKDDFEKKHGVRLGFMPFFVKAVVEALKEFPTVNASIDGNDIIYHDFMDVGIAVGTERGLVVPIVRNAEVMGMSTIEKTIRGYAAKARDGKLSMEEMTGGTFTITNGGVYGSMMSTPIINAPQSAILGMHAITERPVVENGEVVVRPMMYLALSYDHRIIDGSESVRFLVHVKQMLEDPARMLLEV